MEDAATGIKHPSKQVRLASNWGRIDEKFIPSALTFNEDGLPNADACRDFNSRYKNVENLYDPPKLIDVSKPVAFLHIPPNVGSSVEDVYGTNPTQKSLSTELETVAPRGYQCEGRVDEAGSTCKCMSKHLPPRYIKPNPYSTKSTFCVTRDPLDRLLSKYRVTHGDEATPKGAAHWLELIPMKFELENGDHYCQIMHQYEYIWDENGDRTCDHIIRFEDGVANGINKVLNAYPMSNQAHMVDGCLGSEDRRDYNTPITVKDIPKDVAAEVRKFYWRDYCLLGYHSDNPWLTGARTGPTKVSAAAGAVCPSAQQPVQSTPVAGVASYVKISDGTRSSSSSSYSSSNSFGSSNSFPVKPTSFAVTTNGQDSASDLPLDILAAIKPSKQVQAAAAWASINESFIPPSLTFDEEGYPSAQGCADFKQLYHKVRGLHDPQKAALGKPNQVTFLHIPGAGNNEIHNFIPGIFKHHAIFKGISAQGQDCGSSGSPPPAGSTCGCHVAHVPPRYIKPWSMVFGEKILFCVTREPIDRAIAVFFNTNPHANQQATMDWLRELPHSFNSRTDDSYCSTMPQYEFIWNEHGRRSCHHVLRYENGLARGVNELMDAYGRADSSHFHMRTKRQKEHSAITVDAVPLDVAAALRRFYWRDYCLLGYNKESAPDPDLSTSEDSAGRLYPDSTQQAAANANTNAAPSSKRSYSSWSSRSSTGPASSSSSSSSSSFSSVKSSFFSDKAKKKTFTSGTGFYRRNLRYEDEQDPHSASSPMIGAYNTSVTTNTVTTNSVTTTAAASAPAAAAAHGEGDGDDTTVADETSIIAAALGASDLSRTPQEPHLDLTNIYPRLSVPEEAAAAVAESVARNIGQIIRCAVASSTSTIGKLSGLKSNNAEFSIGIGLVILLVAIVLYFIRLCRRCFKKY